MRSLQYHQHTGGTVLMYQTYTKVQLCIVSLLMVRLAPLVVAEPVPGDMQDIIFLGGPSL